MTLDNDASIFENEEPISSLSPSDTIFHLSGHIVFSKVIKPLFEKIISFLKIDYEKISKQKLNAATEDIIKNRIQEYNNRIDKTDILTILKQSYKECFVQSGSFDFITKIQVDIKRDFN